MTPNIDEAREFLSTIDPEGVFTFQTFDDIKDRNDKRLARIFHGPFDEHVERLSKLNAQGAAICFMPCKGDGKGRRNENVREVRSLFVDLDHNTNEGLAKIQALPEAAKPHIIVESSLHRYHAYWLFGPGFPLGSFVKAQTQLAERFGGDHNICKLPQVMRIPGFYNHKHGQPFLARVIHND